mgnify:CR=1 FL=1|tara:strand:- start:458 stop:781 length:324 start_codon:yes stop_codon:yes gene_type:complete
MSKENNNNNATSPATKSEAPAPKTAYRFKTVMVEDDTRAQFSADRDALTKKIGHKVTDKTLFDAIMEHTDMSAVEKTLKAQAVTIAAAREEAKIAKLEQKLADMKAS